MWLKENKADIWVAPCSSVVYPPFIYLLLQSQLRATQRQLHFPLHEHYQKRNNRTISTTYNSSSCPNSSQLLVQQLFILVQFISTIFWYNLLVQFFLCQLKVIQAISNYRRKPQYVSPTSRTITLNLPTAGLHLEASSFLEPGLAHMGRYTDFIAVQAPYLDKTPFRRS